MSGDGYGSGRMGANMGFGYLDDDDDDAAAGGATPAAFDALVNMGFSQIVNVAGASGSFSVDTSSSGGAQTNGVFTLTVSRSFGFGPETVYVGSVSTTDAAGWSETGWSESGVDEPWTNTFTKASIGADETSTLNFTLTMTGDGGADLGIAVNTTTPAPKTDQATGSGSSGFATTLD